MSLPASITIITVAMLGDKIAGFGGATRHFERLWALPSLESDIFPRAQQKVKIGLFLCYATINGIKVTLHDKIGD